MKRKMKIILLLIMLLGIGCSLAVHGQSNEKEKSEFVRIGVYDSRCICIAYAHSHFASERYRKMKAESDAAQAAGDEQRTAEIKEAANKQQTKQHLQGFGTAPVHEYLDLVKEQLPQAAKDAGVDVIVSKWEFDYLAPDAKVMDITMELAQLFQPRQKAYQWIEQMKNIDPRSEKEIRAHEDH